MTPLYEPAEIWTPVRTIRFPQACITCGTMIRPARPGSTTGTRGTKAYFNAAAGIWECAECRPESSRADEASRAARAHPTVEACESCRFSRLSTDLPAAAPLFALIGCTGCERGEGRGFDRHCPQCGHVEHRIYAAFERHQLEGAA